MRSPRLRLALTTLLASCASAETPPVAEADAIPAEADAIPAAPAAAPLASARARVVLLGTGTPVPDPRHSGPCVAVVVGDQPYLVDAGPGLVRQAAAAYERGVPQLAAHRLDIAFLTHLHSDHTVGLPDLIHTPWVVGRRRPLRLYGPPGLQEMVGHLEQAWSADRRVRTLGTEQLPIGGGAIQVTEIGEPGEVYRDEQVVVTAITVPHGTWDHAYAYRFDTSDRRIVVSGDTAQSDAIAEACDGCDVLVHEVFSKAGLQRLGERHLGAYHGTFHTSTVELAELAAKARPKKLVLYHQLYMGASDEELVKEIEALWDGDVVSGGDLDVF